MSSTDESLRYPTIFQTDKPSQYPTKVPTYEPSQYPTIFPTNSLTLIGYKEMILHLTTDSFPRETSWKVLGIDGTIYKNSGNIYDQKNTLYEEAEYLLAYECYTFTIIDKAGDGFIDLGQYTLFWDGKVIHESKSTYIPGTNQVR